MRRIGDLLDRPKAKGKKARRAMLDPGVGALLEKVAQGKVSLDMAVPLLVHAGIPEDVARQACCGKPPPVQPPAVHQHHTHFPKEAVRVDVTALPANPTPVQVEAPVTVHVERGKPAKSVRVSMVRDGRGGMSVTVERDEE